MKEIKRIKRLVEIAVFVGNFLKSQKVSHKNLDNSPFHSELPTISTRPATIF